jgi:hypothetical protein
MFQLRPNKTASQTHQCFQTLLLVVLCIVARLILPLTAPTFVAFGLVFSHIWCLYTSPTTTTTGANTATATATTTTTTTTTATATTSRTTNSNRDDNVADITSDCEYSKLSFVKADGALSVGKNTYILNHPLSLVSYAVFHKFPALPCPEVPELISIDLAEETEYHDDVAGGGKIIQRQRIITSNNIVPPSIGGGIGLAATTMVLERSEEIEGVSLEFVAQNEDAQEYVTLQVWENFEQLADGTTKVTAETWLATPGLNWLIGKAVQRFASSIYSQKSPQSKEILVRRCNQVKATGEHLLNNTESVDFVTPPPPETPSRPS